MPKPKIPTRAALRRAALAERAAAPEPCQNQAQHTVHPTSYLGHSAWAEQMMLTHDQHQCFGCDRMEIWLPKDPASLFAPAIADNDCTRCDKYYPEGALIRTDEAGGWIASCCPATETNEVPDYA